MSFEQVIAAHTEALNAHTAALLSQGGTVAASKPAAAKADKPAAAKTEKAPETKAEPAGLDYETQVKPRVLAVVKAKGREVVDALLLENFSVKSAKEVKPADYQALLDKLAEAESAEADVA